MPSIYKLSYPGVETMQRHDAADALRRWCADWGPSKADRCYYNTEWITIEAKEFAVRGRKRVRYIGTVGSDYSDSRRTVAFEIGAPPPPSFFQPALISRTEQLAREAAYWALRDARYEQQMIVERSAPILREIRQRPGIEPQPPSGPPVWKGIDTAVRHPMGGVVNWEVDGSKPPAKPVLPPPPRYRRN